MDSYYHWMGNCIAFWMLVICGLFYWEFSWSVILGMGVIALIHIVYLSIMEFREHREQRELWSREED